MIDALWIVIAGLAMVLSPLFPFEASAADSEQGVGVVGEYRPAAGRFTITRLAGHEHVPVRIGTVVIAGDQVTLPAGSSLLVHLADSTTRSFQGPGTFEIPNTRGLGNKLHIFSSIKALFDDEYRLTGTAASRGAESCSKGGVAKVPIDVPILASEARIVAGRRDLPLAWRGGCEPFVVTVRSDSRTIAMRDSVGGRQLRFDNLPMPAGHYTVAISDANGARFEAPLEAVSRGPALPFELTQDSSPLGVIAQALWIADQDGGRWRIASFERLRPLIRTGDPLAGAIGDGVLRGQWSPR